VTIAPELEAQILRYYHVEKWRAGTIARQLHVHHGTVRRVLAQAGLPSASGHQRPSQADRYLPFIEQEFPHLAERYRNTYGNSAYAGQKYREGLARFFEKLCAKYGVRGWSGRDDEEEGDEALGALVPSLQLSFEV